MTEIVLDADGQPLTDLTGEVVRVEAWSRYRQMPAPWRRPEPIQLNEHDKRAVRWFVDHLDVDPEKMHVRGIYTDETGYGSRLGAKALSKNFESWLAAGERTVRREWIEEPCQHTVRGEDGLCDACVIVEVDDGQVVRVGERGTIRREIATYRWPLRAAMAKIRTNVVADGLPNLALTALTLARAEGDVTLAADVLARDHPKMGDDRTAVKHFRNMIALLRKAYSEAPSWRPPADRSDAQLNAESANTQMQDLLRE